MTTHLSKSLLNSFRQCPRRLWLELQDRRARREGRQPLAPVQYSADTLKRFAEGHVVGRIAQAMWPQGLNIEDAAAQSSLGPRRDLNQAKRLTLQAIGQRQALFEATFEHEALLVQADVLLPVRGGWQMLEVKSSTAPKDYHYSDLATQTWVAEQTGVPLRRMGLLLVNKDFELRRSGDYSGFLSVHDGVEVQTMVREHMQTMPATVRAARKLATLDREPTQHDPGTQCTTPFECPYQTHCSGIDAKPSANEASIRFYKDKGASKAQQLIERGHTDLRRVPETEIKELWPNDKDTHHINRRLAQAVRTGKPVLDHAGVLRALKRYDWPVQHLDFETINFTAPVWPGTCSGQQVPFQYSVHVQARKGKVLAHHQYLNTSGDDPRRSLAEKLLNDLSANHTIMAWNATFERTVIRELAEQFADLKTALLRLHDQVEDLLPVVRQHYAHPDMVHATAPMFSIKTVLPLIVPGMGYDQLEGVQNGGDAQASYLRVAAPEPVRRNAGYSDAEREQEIDNMLRYCGMDTEAMAAITLKLLAP